MSTSESNENVDVNITSSTSTSESDGNVYFQSLSNTENRVELNMQMKTIPLKEYKILMNLIPENEKLRNTIEKLEREIKLKDLKLKEEQQLHQTNQSNCIDLSHLQAVSISFDF